MIVTRVARNRGVEWRTLLPASRPLAAQTNWRGFEQAMSNTTPTAPRSRARLVLYLPTEIFKQWRNDRVNFAVRVRICFLQNARRCLSSQCALDLRYPRFELPQTKIIGWWERSIQSPVCCCARQLGVGKPRALGRAHKPFVAASRLHEPGDNSDRARFASGEAGLDQHSDRDKCAALPERRC